LLTLLPRTEMKRINDENLEKYYDVFYKKVTENGEA